MSIERQIAEVKRELAMRRRVYPRFVETGRMTQQQAERFMADMEEVLQTLQLVQGEMPPKAPELFP
jgi:polyhydroxyalkanoate synthesis regulator phasin